ncbi:hypothetical protein NX059_004100 [Plenodomus lindquistii]|nr:hypothetical protein NX059_004100 [Plenodomus lindquistii]
MKLTPLLTAVLCWTVSVIAKDYPLPAGWGSTKPPPKGSVSRRSDDPHSAEVLLGINCRGSGRCVSCNTDIPFLQTITDRIPDNYKWTNGQLIACSLCHQCRTCPDADKNGLCVFPQNLKEGEVVTGAQIKQAIKAIRDHGCNRCGSVPLHPGNDVEDGELTINFVFNGCGEQIC